MNHHRTAALRWGSRIRVLHRRTNECRINSNCTRRSWAPTRTFSYFVSSELLPTNNNLFIGHRHHSTLAVEASVNESTEASYSELFREGVRNVAVIAHVDHGKTTLVDQLLRASNGGDENRTDRLMDSGELEQERGITITSKVTRLEYNGIINCVDTPGHADFCGEVDRVLSLVDGVVLVVDAGEGPMTQTKYVLGRAIRLGLMPIVVLNKCDRPEAIGKIDSGETEEQLDALFDSLGASQAQKDHVTLYASARKGWITDDPLEALELAEDGSDSSIGMAKLLDVIGQEVPAPVIRSYKEGEVDQTIKDEEAFEWCQDDKFSLAAVTVGLDSFLGRSCMGRILSGSVSVGDEVTCWTDSDTPVSSKVSGVFVYKGVSRAPFDGTAYAGDIVTVAGVPDHMAVGDTLTGAKNPVNEAIETPPIAPPTLSMDFGSNNGALAGKEGTKLASSQIRDRLVSETDNNVTLRVEKSVSDSDKTVVYARGELQLGILVEQMRREGFELVISPPQIVTKKCPETGTIMEPFEEVIVDVDSEYTGAVVSSLTGDRKGVLLEMNESQDGKTRLVLEVPSRGLLGFTSEIATQTKGSAVVTHLFVENRPFIGSLGVNLEKSKLVSNAQGKATSYALDTLSARGTLFVEPGDMVYSGLVVGESAKTGPDMEVNPVKAKETTNMRTQSKEEKVTLAPPKKRTVEELIGYMSEDEVIEVTPQSVRLRKVILDSSARERAARQKAKQIRSMGKK